MAHGQTMVHFLMDWEGPTVGGAIPGKVVLGALRKQSEQAMKGKSVSRFLPLPLR